MLRFLLLFLLTPVVAQGQSENMTLLTRLDPGPGFYSDVWGYVGPDGREYALLASWIDGGLNVIDVTDAVPVLEERVPMNGDGSDVEFYSHYAYLTSNSDPTQIIDLEDPTDPAPLGIFGFGAHTLSIAGDYLYANGNSGTEIWSLANPEVPVLVGQYSPYYVHDVLVRGDTLYTAGIYGDGIDIVDIADRANPVLIERFNYPGSGAHNICSDPSGSYLYVGDEIGIGRWTRIFDVRDPQNVEQVGEIIIDASSTVHNCHTKDERLYLAHYNRGVWVYDISDPVAPVEVGFYETGVSGFGVWTVNPNLPSGKILASDGENGLLVLRLDGTVASEGGPEVPAAFALGAAYPNPFAGATTLRFSLAEASEVRLSVHDALGREVAVVAEGPRAAGSHEAAFDGAALPSGLYLVRLDVAGQRLTRRISLVR